MPLSEASTRRAASEIVKGRVHPLAPIGHLPTECQPRGVADAMAIQDAVHELLTERGHGNVVGSKIGCTTKVMQEFLGMTHPCSGGIFATTVHHGTDEFDFNSFLHVGVECEIAMTLKSALRATDAPHKSDTVRDAVGAFYPAIEIVDDRYVDFVARQPDWRTWLADDFFGAGMA